MGDYVGHGKLAKDMVNMLLPPHNLIHIPLRVCAVIGYRIFPVLRIQRRIPPIQKFHKNILTHTSRQRNTAVRKRKNGKGKNSLFFFPGTKRQKKSAGSMKPPADLGQPRLLFRSKAGTETIPAYSINHRHGRCKPVLRTVPVGLFGNRYRLLQQCCSPKLPVG